MAVSPKEPQEGIKAQPGSLWRVLTVGKGPRCPSEGTQHSHPEKSEELSLGRCHERPEGGYGAHACELNVTGTHTASFKGHPLGAVTTDTFPFDFPSLYPKSNHNVNAKSKFQSPLSHRDQEHAGTVVQVETCPHPLGRAASEGKSRDPE